ncbi:MAG: hypothetical protein M3228_05590 [Actinomycetota bacterium]|nr:hypothetical protein [Actinomycetota bacterium]
MVAMTGAIDGVREKQGYRQVVISIANSAIAAALMVGPSMGGTTFTESVQKGLGLGNGSIVWRSLCFTALIVSVGAAMPSITVQFRKNSVSAEVVVPSMTLVCGLIILAITATGFVRGQGVVTVEPISLVPSISSMKDGDTYSATAKGFLPGEVVKFSWVGRPMADAPSISGPMADAPPADSGGSTTLLPIVQTAPPGNYTITARGQTSGRTATAEVRVVQPGN